MGQIILPREYYPQLGVPGKKPTGPVVLNKKHPLAPDELCMILGGDYRDLTGKHETSPLSGVIPFSPVDGNLAYNRSGTSTVTEDVIDIFPAITPGDNDPWTIIVRLRTTGANPGVFCGDATTTDDLFWAQDGTWFEFRGSIDANEFARFTGITDFSSMTTLAMSSSGSGATSSSVRACQDGVFIGEITGVTTNFILNAIGTGYSLDNTFDLDGDIEFFYWYNWDLSDVQKVEVSKNPYQFIEPSLPMVYFTPSAVSGFQAAWARQQSGIIGAVGAI